MVRDRYPKLLADDAAYEAGMWHVAGRTYDLVEFLTTIVKADLTGLRWPGSTAAYHPACPLRTLAVPDETPRVLRQLGVTPEAGPRRRRLLRLRRPVRRRLPVRSAAPWPTPRPGHIASAGADVTVCNEAGCTMTIAAAAERAGTAGRVVHVAELLADALGLDADRW